MSLEALRITECPLAFADLAAKHNALISMIAGMTGQNGVTVTLAERNILIKGGGSGGGTDAALTDRVAALETLTSGMSRQNVLYCSSGSNTTITILRT